MLSLNPALSEMFRDVFACSSRAPVIYIPVLHLFMAKWNEQDIFKCLHFNLSLSSPQHIFTWKNTTNYFYCLLQHNVDPLSPVALLYLASLFDLVFPSADFFLIKAGISPEEHED